MFFILCAQDKNLHVIILCLQLSCTLKITKINKNDLSGLLTCVEMTLRTQQEKKVNFSVCALSNFHIFSLSSLLFS